MSDRSGRPGGRTYDETLWPTGTKAIIEDMRPWAHETQAKLKVDGPQRTGTLPDLVKRLRDNFYDNRTNITDEAADEIERLRNGLGMVIDILDCHEQEIAIRKCRKIAKETLDAYAKDRNIE